MSKRGWRVLHVEDDPSLQKLVRIALEQLGGYEVRSAGDGRKAIELARESRPDLFLLDLDLPEMDGVGTLAALREIEGLCEAPAVFLTAIATPQVTQRLRSLGALDVLGKPFRPRDLVQSLNRALGQALA